MKDSEIIQALKENKDLLSAMQQRNLVYNHNFVNYSNAVQNGAITEFGHPDGWIYSDPGVNGEIGYSQSLQACRIVTSSGMDRMTFSQALHEFPRWETTLREKTVTAKLVVNTSENCTLTFELIDGIGASTKTSMISGDAELEVTLDVSSRSEELRVIVSSESSQAVINIKEIYANIGSIALNTLPNMVEGVIGERRQYISAENAPAHELSLCQESHELSRNYSRLDSVLNGRFGKGMDNRSLLPDMRGYFSRSWNNGSTIDPDALSRAALENGPVTGDHVGTVQQDVFKAHSHGLKFDHTVIVSGTDKQGTALNLTTTSQTEDTGGDETRPKNIYELYTIKWA